MSYPLASSSSATNAVCKLADIRHLVDDIMIYIYILCSLLNAVCICVCVGGGVSSVGIATCYGLEDLGIESRWGEIFSTRPDSPWAHPASYTVGTGSFSGVKRLGRQTEQVFYCLYGVQQVFRV